MIADKYIAKIKALWNPDERVISALQANAKTINEKLASFYWTEIDAAIEMFYIKTSAHDYPRIEQILARLNTDKQFSKRVSDLPPIPMPSTKLKKIQGIYPDICRWAHIQGLCCFEYFDKVEHIPVGNKSTTKIVRKEDGTQTVILENKLWKLEVFIIQAEKDSPDIFSPYTGLNTWEKVALLVVAGRLRV